VVLPRARRSPSAISHTRAQTGVRPGMSRARCARPNRDHGALPAMPLARRAVALQCRTEAGRSIPSAAMAPSGKGADPMTSETEIRPFRVDLPEAEIAELRRRIVATRWPDQETVTDDSQGVRLALRQDLVRYWGTDYDWRTCERNLNALPQFMTGIDGLDIHFIHVRSQHEDALPSTPSPSRSRSPSASSPTSSTRPRRAGPSAPTPTTSSTTTRSTGAATSPPGSSQTSSPPRCGRHSRRCANQTSTDGGHQPRAVPEPTRRRPGARAIELQGGQCHDSVLAHARRAALRLGPAAR